MIHLTARRYPARGSVPGVIARGAHGFRATLMAGLLASLLAVLAGPSAWAQAEKSDKATKLPRFASLRSDDVNVRTGPGVRYPVDWKFVRRDLPVEIVAEYDTWRKIRDWENAEGWVNQSMLSSRRYVMVTGDKVQELHRTPDDAAAVVARIEPGVIGQLLQCETAWCRVQVTKVTGWIKRDSVWGVYADEDMK